jgi:hypothetical protein
LGKRISQTVPKRAKKMKKKSCAQEIRFFGKIGFLNRAQTCPKNEKQIRGPRNPIFGKNRISQTVPKHAQKMKNKSCAQEIRFFGKIGFLNRAQTCPKNEKQIRGPRNPIFGKNRISQPCPNMPKK